MLRNSTVGLGALASVAFASSFASSVVEYSPAPGQFVNNPLFNDPADALGPPEGMGISDGNNLTVVTLGGLGGSITLAFDQSVEDDPLNPFGMDAIVFGNAFWVGGNRNRHWAECAMIEISEDANQNGVADDAWFMVAGSHVASAEWLEDALVLPSDLFGGNVVVNIPPGPNVESIWGYADYSPTLLLGDLDGDNLVDDADLQADRFYTTPDDPFSIGVGPGSGGGDAFDIAWAIDPLTGDPANLGGFDFLRITTAVQSSLGLLGEKSAEVDAVADVSPDYFGDADDDRDIDLLDVAEAHACLGSIGGDACASLSRRGDGAVTVGDLVQIMGRMTGPFLMQSPE